MNSNNSDNGMLLAFPIAANVVDLSKCKDNGSSVYVYTEVMGSPVVNYCEKCYGPYYSIVSVNNRSVMSTRVRVSRCSHSIGITPYLRSTNSRN